MGSRESMTKKNQNLLSTISRFEAIKNVTSRPLHFCVQYGYFEYGYIFIAHCITVTPATLACAAGQAHSRVGLGRADFFRARVEFELPVSSLKLAR